MSVDPSGAIDPTREQFNQFKALARDQPVHMLNLVRLRDLARFRLEGLARGGVTYDQEARTERLLTVIKRATHMLNRKGSVQDLWPD